MAKKKDRATSEERPWLSWICSSQDTEELRERYNNWANTYDTDSKGHWFFIPTQMAQTLDKLLDSKNTTILDAGAGTGFVGEALAKLGYTNLIAIDLSEEMLVEAEKKQVYKALYQCNLDNIEALDALGRFDVIVSAGVFAYAHAGVKALNNLFHLLNKNGILLLTIRANYRCEMQQGLEQLAWTLIGEEHFSIYETQVIDLLVFKKMQSL